MAAVAVQHQEVFTLVGGVNFVFSRFVYNASGETVTVPTGSVTAAVIPVTTGTAPTATITQGATGDSVALTSGTTGKEYWLITRHTGGVVAR